MAAGAVALSPLLAIGGTALAGKLPVFGESTGGALLPVKFSMAPFAAAAGAGLLCMAIIVLPAALGGRGGLLTRKLRAARPPRVLALHRYYLDAALLVLGGLVFWELQSRGHFVSGGLFENIEVNEPLLLGPALFMIMVALAFMRILPLVARYIGGESPVLVHALAAASLAILGPGLIISEVRAGEPAGWVAGTLALAAFAAVYAGTAWATMMRFRLAGLLCQALLVCAFRAAGAARPERAAVHARGGTHGARAGAGAVHGVPGAAPLDPRVAADGPAQHGAEPDAVHVAGGAGGAGDRGRDSLDDGGGHPWSGARTTVCSTTWPPTTG